MNPASRRLTVSKLMIAVVAFALSIKLGMAYNKSPRYWEEANFYSRASGNAIWLANLLETEETTSRPPAVATVGVVEAPGIPPYNLRGEERKEAARASRRFAADLDRKRSKYRRAAFLPWLPTAPEVP